MLAEATELMLELWSSDEPVTHHGTHYSTQAAALQSQTVAAAASTDLVR